MDDAEKTMMLRHLRDDEEVYYVIRGVKTISKEVRTLGQALLDNRGKFKGKHKFSHIVLTKLKDSGEPARMLFLHGINAIGPEVSLSKTDTSSETKSTVTVSVPHSIVFSPTLIYRIINEHENARMETQEKLADKSVRKEFWKAELKAMRIAEKEQMRHPSGKIFSSWFEIKSLDVDKKLLQGGFLSLTVVVENFMTRNAKDFGTIEQIKNDMGASAKGASSIRRPFELNLFFGDKTEEMYGKLREIVGV